MSDCLFCRIVQQQIPAKIVYSDEDMLVFHDIAPKAPVHLLAIPKKHMVNLDHLTQDDEAILARMLGKFAQIAKDNGLQQGYRVITNTGAGGGQEVYHLHFHILGDIREASWRGM